MPNTSDQLPTREEELALHRRLIDGDPTASSDLASIYFSPLLEHLRTRNRGISEDLLLDAAAQAWMSLVKNPHSYNPNGMRLFDFLKMSAEGDRRNIQKSERIRAKRTKSLNLLELDPPGRNDPCADLEHAEVFNRVDEILPGILEGLPEDQRQAAMMVLEGERSTARMANALKIEHLPVEEQKKSVKQFMVDPIV